MTANKLLSGRILGTIINYVPLAKHLPNARLQAVRKAFAIMEAKSKAIIADKRAEVFAAGGIGGGKDLISLLRWSFFFTFLGSLIDFFFS